MNKIELIVTDLDNTLLRTDKSISVFTVEIFNRCKKHGIKTAFCTARPEVGAGKFIEILKPDIIITSGGAMIKMDGKIIHECKMPVETSNNLIRDCIINPNVGEIAVDTEKGYYWNSKNISDSPDCSQAIYNDFSYALNLDTYKILVEISEDSTGKELSNTYNELKMITYQGERWHSFSHRNVTKMNAIFSLTKILNIKLDKVSSFGDDYNDAEMIKSCGYGVAVSNASSEAIDAAKYFTLSNDEDGVAKFIQEHFLNDN